MLLHLLGSVLRVFFPALGEAVLCLAVWLHRARDSGSSVNGQALVWCLKEKESLQRVTQQLLVLKLVQETSSAPERDTWVELHFTVADCR